jgi:hypothetical protein
MELAAASSTGLKVGASTALTGTGGRVEGALEREPVAEALTFRGRLFGCIVTKPKQKTKVMARGTARSRRCELSASRELSITYCDKSPP